MAHDETDRSYVVRPILKPQRKFSREPQMRLRTDRLSGQISGEIVVHQPVHVGAGYLMPTPPGTTTTGASMMKAFVRQNNVRVIPGSSLKGAVRSLIEIFSFACVVSDRPLNRRKKQDPRNQDKPFPCPDSNNRICLACKLFGCFGYEGNVQFSGSVQLDDSYAAVEIPAPYNEGKWFEERRYYPHDTPTQDVANPWPMEAVPQGGRFTFAATFRNLTAGELGVLLIALGQGEPALCLKLGGGKNAGLGSVRFVGKDSPPLVVTRIDLNNAYRELTMAYTAVDTAHCLAQASTLIDAGALAAVQQHLACANLGATTT